jgi:hypothetical protein
VKTIAFAIMTSSWFLGSTYIDVKVDIAEGKVVAYIVTLILFTATCIIGMVE